MTDTQRGTCLIYTASDGTRYLADDAPAMWHNAGEKLTYGRWDA